MGKMTQYIARFWMVLLLLIVLQPSLLHADLVIDNKDIRNWVPVRIQIVNASKFKGMTFFLRYDQNLVPGEPEKLVEVKPGQVVPVALGGNGKGQLIAKDASGKIFASVVSLEDEVIARNEEVEYAIQRLRIVQAANDSLTFETMKLQYAKDGKKGPKFLKADVVNESGSSFTYVWIAIACAAGLGLFFFLRRRNQSH
jgi:hypothetical protein